MPNAAEVILRFVGDVTGFTRAADEVIAKDAEVEASAESASGKLEQLGTSADTTGGKMEGLGTTAGSVGDTIKWGGEVAEEAAAKHEDQAVAAEHAATSLHSEGQEAETTTGFVSGLFHALTDLAVGHRESASAASDNDTVHRTLSNVLENARAEAEKLSGAFEEMGYSGEGVNAQVERMTALLFQERGPSVLADALRDTEAGARLGEEGLQKFAKTASSDFVKGEDDAEKGAVELGRGVTGLEGVFKKAQGPAQALGRVLGLLGASGGVEETGLKGALAATEGATTGFQTFIPSASGAEQAVTYLTLASQLLIPALIGLVVAFSPLIAAVLSFTVALAGALAVMAIGIGAPLGLAAGITALGVATGKVTGPLDQLKTTWEGVATTLENQVAPIASQMIGWLNQWAAPVERLGQSALRWLGGVLPQVLRMVTPMVQALFPFLQQLGSIFSQMTTYVLSNAGAFQGLWRSALGLVIQVVEGLVKNLIGLSDWFFKNLPAFEPLIKAVFGVIGTVIQDAARIVGALGLAFANFFSGIGGKQGEVQPLVKALEDIGLPADKARGLVRGLLSAIHAFVDFIKGAVQIVIDFGKHFASSFLSSYSGAGQTFERIEKALGPFMGALKNTASSIGTIAGTIVSSNLFGLFEKAAPVLLHIGTVILQTLNPALQFLAQHAQMLYPLIIGLGVAFAGFKIASATIDGVNNVASSIRDARIQINQFAENMHDARQAMSSFADKIGDVVSKGADLVKSIASSTVELAKNTLEWIKNTAQLVASNVAKAAHAVWSGIASAATAVWSGIQAVFNAIMDANPIVLVILAIAALIAIIILVVTHWKQVTAVVQEVWDKLKPLRDWLANTFGPILRSIADWFKNAWDTVVKDVGGFFSGLGTAVHNGWEHVKQFFQNAFNEIRQIVQNFWPLILIVLPGGFFLAAIGMILTHWNQVRQLFQNGLNFIRNLWSNATEFLRNLIQGYLNREAQGWQNLFSGVRQLAQNFWNWVENVWNTVTDWLGNLIGGWWDDEKQGWQDLFNAVRQLAQNFWNWVENLWDNTLGWLWTRVSGWWDDLKTLWNEGQQFIRNLLQDWINWVRDTWQGIVNWITNLVSGAFTRWKTDWSTFFTDLRSLVSNALDGIVGFFSNLPGRISSALKNLGNLVHDAFRSGLNQGLQLLRTFESGINKLLTAVKIPALPSLPTSLAAGGKIPNYAQGGAMREVGEGFIAERPTFIIRALVGEGEGSGGGPEYVIPTAPAHRGNALRLWGEVGQQIGAFAQGGEIGDLMSVGMRFVEHLAGGGAVGTHGGQCVVYVENVEGIHFNVEYAKQMASYVNSQTPKVGEVFVSGIPPYGHTGIVNGPNSVIDSNWDLDEIIHIHPLSDIPDMLGYIDLGKGLPAGVQTGSSPGAVAGAVAGIASSAIQALEKPLTSGVSALASKTGLPGQMMQGIVTSLISGVTSAFATQPTSSTASSSSTPAAPGSLQGWIQQAIQLTGVDPSWAAGLTTIAMHESGGNPSVDQTGLTGYAQAHGVMQMINSTFAAYALPGHTDIYNAVDNIAAAIEYIKARYGNPNNTPGIRSINSGGSYQGYASGGIALTPQLAALAENGPEAVLPLGAAMRGGELSDQTDLLQQAVDILKQIAAPRPTVPTSFSARVRHA